MHFDTQSKKNVYTKCINTEIFLLDISLESDYGVTSLMCLLWQIVLLSLTSRLKRSDSEHELWLRWHGIR